MEFFDLLKTFCSGTLSRFPKSAGTGFAPTTTPAYAPSPSRSVARSAPAQVGRDHAVAVSAGSVPARPPTCEYVCRCPQIRLRPFIDHERPDLCVVGKADTDVVQDSSFSTFPSDRQIAVGVSAPRSARGEWFTRIFGHLFQKIEIFCKRKQKALKFVVYARIPFFFRRLVGKSANYLGKHIERWVYVWGLEARPQSSVGVSPEPRSLHWNSVLKYYSKL